jgi:hypothetical protein
MVSDQMTYVAAKPKTAHDQENGTVVRAQMYVDGPGNAAGCTIIVAGILIHICFPEMPRARG